MKNLLFLAGFYLVSLFSYAQICEGDVVLTTQAEVDDFNCETVQGTLIISGPNITSLSGLYMLKEVGEHLIIHNSPALTSLAGLENLTDVTCSFEIKDCAAVKDLTGLDKLDSVGRNFTVIRNQNLLTLDGLNSLRYALNVQVFENPLLSECCAIKTLTEAATQVTIYNNAPGCDLPSLDYCDSSQKVCSGTVWITSQEMMDNFNCEIIKGDLIIGDQTASTRFISTANLKSLKEVTGNISLNFYSQTPVEGLGNIERVGGGLYLLDATISLDSLKSLEYLGGIDARFATIKGSFPKLTGTLDKARLETLSVVERSDWMGGVDSIRELGIDLAAPLDIQPSLEKLMNGGSLFIYYAQNIEGLEHIDSLEFLDFYGGSPESLEPLSGLKFVNDFTFRNLTLPEDYCSIYPLVSNRISSSSFRWEQNSVSLEELIANCSDEEIVCDGDIRIQTQEDMDNFFCNVVEGNLYLTNYQDKINDFDHLLRLNKVKGNFLIEGYLPSTYLSNLESVMGSLHLETSSTFDLSGMTSLVHSNAILVVFNQGLTGQLPVFQDTLNEMTLVYAQMDNTVGAFGVAAIDTLQLVGTNYSPVIEKLREGGYLRINGVSDNTPLDLLGLTGKEYIGTLLIDNSFLSFEGLEALKKVDDMDIHGVSATDDCCGLYNFLTTGIITHSFLFENNSCTVEEIVWGCAPEEVLAEMSVYPNPTTSGSVDIEWNGHPDIQTTIQVIDNFGREVSRKTLAASPGRQHLEMEISNLEQGYYLIRIITGDEVQLKRLVRQ